DSVRVESVQKINPTTVQVKFSNNQLLLVDFYADNIFRLFQDNKSAVVRDPQAEPAAQILVNNPRKKLHNFELLEKDGSWFISTKDAAMEINKENGLFKIYNIKNKKMVTQSIAPISSNKKKISTPL